MPAPDPLAGTGEEFTAYDWKEYVGNFRPSGPNSFSQEGGEGALTGLVPALKVRGALRFCLGYNFVPFSGPFLLRRTNPIYHPRYPGLICTAAAEEEFSPAGRDKNAAIDSLKHFSNTAKEGSDAPLYTDPKLPFRAGYAKARITLRFQPVSMRLAEDSDIDALPGGRADREFARNTWIDTEPRVEVLSLDGFTLKYAEGQANTAPLTNPFGKEFPAPFGQLLAKPDVTLTWKWVPAKFLTSNAAPSDLPVNIVNCLGKVNSAEFRGYPAGTLLLMGAKLEKKPWPLALGQEDPWNYNVTFMFSYFNPPKGKTGDVQIVTNLGHNNMPWKGDLIAGDSNAGKWFLSTRTGGSGAASIDPRLLEEADFVTMFRRPA